MQKNGRFYMKHNTFSEVKLLWICFSHRCVLVSFSRSFSPLICVMVHVLLVTVLFPSPWKHCTFNWDARNCLVSTQDVNVVVIFKALGIESDQEIVQMVGTEEDILNAFSPSLEECNNCQVYTRNQVNIYLVAVLWAIAYLLRCCTTWFSSSIGIFVAGIALHRQQDQTENGLGKDED